MSRLRLHQWMIVLAAIVANGPMPLWSADSPAMSNSDEVVRGNLDASAGSSRIVTTGFTSSNQLRNTVIDNCEDMRIPSASPGGLRQHLARSQQMTRARIRAHDLRTALHGQGEERCWLCYIRGHGPADWKWPY